MTPILRNLLPCLALLALTVGLSGCDRAQANAGGPVTEIQFWNGFSGPDGQVMEKLVREFNKQNPDVKVRMQIIPWATYYDKLTLGLAFDGAPEVFVLHAARIPEYASHGALYPMDSLVSTSGLTESDFVPKAWQAGIYEGKRYGFPLDCHPLGMYYNVKLFEEAGIKGPPTTMAEFVDAARKLTKDANGDGKPEQWGYAMTDIHLVGTTFLFQFGGGLLTPDLRRSALDTPESQAGVEALMSFADREKVSPPPAGNDGWMAFQEGRVGMVFQGIWMIDSLESQRKTKGLRYAAAPVPFFGPVKTVWAGSHSLCMPAKVNDTRKVAAWRFIKYLSDRNLEWAKGGQVPVRNDVLNSPEFQALPVQREFAKQLPYVTFEPPSVVVNQISAFADSAIDASLNHIEPAEKQLKTAARRVNNVLRRQ